MPRKSYKLNHDLKRNTAVPVRINELLFLVNNITKRNIKERALKYWFSWCDISRPSGNYYWSDISRLGVFGLCLNQYGNIPEAYAKYQILLEEYSDFFEDDTENTVDALEIQLQSNLKPPAIKTKTIEIPHEIAS